MTGTSTHARPAVQGALDLLGPRIRRARLARSLTLVTLAERAELSHSFLSQVERGLAAPSMASLERIAVALGVGLVELMPAGPRRRQVETAVLRADEGVRGPYGAGEARLLGPEMLRFVPIDFTGCNAALGDAYRHSEAEFLLVAEGAIALELDGREHPLRPGDSAVIAGGTAHRWRSADGGPYRLFLVKEELGSLAALSRSAGGDA